MRNEIDQQFPYIQVHRSVAAKAAMLAAQTGVEYFKLRGVLDCWWESLADRRILAKAIETSGVLQTQEQVEQSVTKPCGGLVSASDLVASGFLEAKDGLYRVRGMSRYISAEDTRRTRVAHGSERGRSGVGAGSERGTTRQTKDERRKTIDERVNTKESTRKTTVGPAVSDAVAVVFEHWAAVMAVNGAVLSPKRRRAVDGRLADGYDVAALKEAIDGCAKTPHNMGQNDRGTKFNDLELICRSPENVDRFRSATGPVKSASAPVASESVDWTKVPAGEVDL